MVELPVVLVSCLEIRMRVDDPVIPLYEACHMDIDVRVIHYANPAHAYLSNRSLVRSAALNQLLLRAAYLKVVEVPHGAYKEPGS